MTDCANGLMRDQLPEYAHGVLGSADLARVTAHLAACEECRAELALIGRVQEGLALGVRRVDVAAIVAALPAPRGSVRAMPRRWVSWHVWQYAAAAVLVLVVGGGIVLRRAPDVTAPRVADSSHVGGGLGMAGAPSPAANADAGITFGGGLSDLSLDELQALLGQLDSVRTLPSADPQSMIPVIAINEGDMTQ